MSRRVRLFRDQARLAVQLGNHECAWAGCHVPVTDCQIDHIDKWTPKAGRHRAARSRRRVYVPRERGTTLWQAQPIQGTRLHRLARRRRQVAHVPARRHRNLTRPRPALSGASIGPSPARGCRRFEDLNQISDARCGYVDARPADGHEAAVSAPHGDGIAGNNVNAAGLMTGVLDVVSHLVDGARLTVQSASQQARERSLLRGAATRSSMSGAAFDHQRAAVGFRGGWPVVERETLRCVVIRETESHREGSSPSRAIVLPRARDVREPRQAG